jgi:gluconate 5-dehydrogenase
MMIQQTFTQAFDLSDELVLITGGGTGLGFGMAQCLKQAGAKIVLTGRRESVLQEAAQKLGDSTGYRVHDVTDWDSSKELIESIESEIGRVTTIINNAGNHVKKQDSCKNSHGQVRAAGRHRLGGCLFVFPGSQFRNRDMSAG